MDKERRQRYRVRRGLKILSFRVYMLAEDYEQVGTDILNLSSEGIALSFAGETTPRFAPNTSVDLRFVFAEGKSCKLRAAVRWRHDEAGTQAYGMEFIDPAVLHAILPTRLFELFNRREWARAAGPQLGVTAVQIRRKSGDIGLKARLLDISTGGCALLVGAAPAVGRGTRLELGFTLPSLPSEVRLAAVIRSVDSVDGQLRCGLKFDRHVSKELATQHEQLMRSVGLHQA